KTVCNDNLNDKNEECQKAKPIEVIGDNLDICISPAKMTMDKQRHSLHCFLTMVKQRRVTYEDLNVQSDTCQTPILDISTHQWIPSKQHMDSVTGNFIFHISHTRLKYVKCLEPVKESYQSYIPHKCIDITKEKSVVLNCDLIDASENSSQGMIEILQKVHELTVPHTQDTVIQKVVFGGDVLTNERAFSAQEAMQNNKSPYASLCGIIHRPEGLHRQFNFLQVIYQLFYKENSSMDRGSLYHLRSWINRRDVSGPKEVVQKFRPHQQFIDDVLDAYLVGVFLDMMDMETVTSEPRSPPLLNLMNNEQKVKWLNSVSKNILANLNFNEFIHINQLRHDLECLNDDDNQIEAMKQGDIYNCALCNKTYTCLPWFKKHLVKKHQWKFHQVNSEVDSSNAVKNFIFMALLFRDTCDSYKMGDGERIVRNAHFEWLYDSAVKHSKYKIWLWRMISYVISILGIKESFEYKWNMTVNLKGGICNNIPNDNCVELQVGNIKRELNTQGANKSYESAKMICMTTQVVDAIREQLIRTTKTARSKRDRPAVDKSKDIICMIQCLRQQGYVKGITWKSFSTYRDPLQCVDADELHSCINKQKKIANLYL
ncbi:uncharacterized protein LOC128551443, partial [Mercenaria mercenaria]|uniref:uncharacterized protein LOC128551443 n=1 Tax=Mercenaria mercenaria TaxID=6596 RepID=UPI00234F9DBC